MRRMPVWPDWLRKPRLARGTETSPLDVPLRGVPVVRRVKNYAAFSGYVYEYLFAGYRDSQGRREYVFSVSGDRKSWFEFQVRVASAATEAWEREREFVLGDRERYALAKLALFSAFDERTNPGEMRGSVNVTPEMAAELLEKLDL